MVALRPRARGRRVGAHLPELAAPREDGEGDRGRTRAHARLRGTLREARHHALRLHARSDAAIPGRTAARCPSCRSRHSPVVSSRCLPATSRSRSPRTHFVECIRTGVEPLTSGARSLRVVEVLEQAIERPRAGASRSVRRRRDAPPDPEPAVTRGRSLAARLAPAPHRLRTRLAAPASARLVRLRSSSCRTSWSRSPTPAAGVSPCRPARAGASRFRA